MQKALLVVFLVVAIALVALIMLQQGKGAGMGASFGAGTVGSLFSSSGSTTFITRTTAILASLFFSISLVLGNINRNMNDKGSEWKNLNASVDTDATQPAELVESIDDIPK